MGSRNLTVDMRVGFRMRACFGFARQDEVDEVEFTDDCFCNIDEASGSHVQGMGTAVQRGK